MNTKCGLAFMRNRFVNTMMCPYNFYFQMYSYFYDKSETWAVWPNHLSLSEFTSKRSAIVISHIFRYFFDELQNMVNNFQDNILNDKSALTDAMTELDSALSNYGTTVEVCDNFVR